INTLSTQLNRYRRRSRYLDNTCNDLQSQLKYIQSEVERLQGLNDVQRTMDLQREVNQLRRNYERRDVVRLFVVIELAYAERRRKAFLPFYRLALSLFLFLASN
ncbi:14986_t:CDS:2, partial [Funneliformis caledonium]